MAERGVWRGRGPVWRAALSLVVVLIVVAGLVAAAMFTEVEKDLRAATTERNEPELPAPSPGLLAAGDRAPAPDPAALGRIIDPLASDPAVGDLTGQVVDDATGQVLWERRPHDAKVPASTAKLLTAVAALTQLPGDKRVETTFAAGAEPGTLVVVPGGDPTMSGGAEPGPLFPEAATLTSAVELVRASGFAPERIVVDPGPYTGPEMGPGWSASEIAGGNVAPVQAWMLDAGRIDPADEYSPRHAEPSLVAGRQLAQGLGVDPEQVTVSAEPVATAHELGSVHSAPLTDRLRAMLVHSDNVLAETLCREVALSVNPDAEVDFAAGTRAVIDTLSGRGIDVSGLRLDDCSGMSSGSRLSASLLTDVLRVASAPDATREMRELLDALPIASATGTLTDRFDGPSGPGAGWVRAKTGTLSGTSALAGTVTSADGRSMTFALLSAGTSPTEARPVLDRITAALRDCGCR